MRLSSGLIVGALLGCASADLIFARQNTGGTSAAPVPRPTTTPESTSESTPATPSPTNDTPSGGNGGGSRPPTGGGGNGGGGGGTDTTVTRTVTVTGDGSVSTTTSFNVVTSTVITTTTLFSTEFVTSQGETATSTVYVTSTEFVDQKIRRSLDAGLAPRTEAPAPAEALPTPAVFQDGRTSPESDLKRRRVILVKRATATVTSTTTVGGGNSVVTITGSSTFFTIIPTVITSVITSTTVANARTTVTTTSTLKVTSTRVAVTAPNGSATTIGSNGGGVSGDSGTSGSGDGDGLSSGAKAGIGVGVGAAGLIFLAAIGFLVWRRRSRPKPVHDDFMGASEVPVGGPSGGGAPDPRPMSEATSAGGYLAATPSHGHKKPEGYRGTALGDGRAGYAQPAPYGAAYATPSRSTTMTNQHRNSLVPGDQLPRHPTPASSSMVSPATETTAELGNDNPAAAAWHNHGAAEIDGQAVMSHQSGPVYEMPTQSYR